MEYKATDYGGVSVLMELKNDEWPLVISFAGLGDQFQFQNILSDQPVNVVYLRDLKHNWYLNGIPDVGNSVEEVAQFLASIITRGHYRKVIAIGPSAGGFAALLYGSLLSVNVIMSFSPQTFMDKLHRLIYLDRRWSDRVLEIYGRNPMSRKYLDVKSIVRSFKGIVRIYFDQSHRIDRIHARRIKGPQIIHEAKRGGGHTLIKSLKDSGKLKELIVNEIN